MRESSRQLYQDPDTQLLYLFPEPKETIFSAIDSVKDILNQFLNAITILQNTNYNIVEIHCSLATNTEIIKQFSKTIIYKSIRTCIKTKQLFQDPKTKMIYLLASPHEDIQSVTISTSIFLEINKLNAEAFINQQHRVVSIITANENIEKITNAFDGKKVIERELSNRLVLRENTIFNAIYNIHEHSIFKSDIDNFKNNFTSELQQLNITTQTVLKGCQPVTINPSYTIIGKSNLFQQPPLSEPTFNVDDLFNDKGFEKFC